MPSIQSKLFTFLLRHRKKRTAWDFSTSIEKFRKDCEKAAKLLGQVADGVKVEKTSIAGLPAEWLIPAGSSEDKAILYTIGGGYVSGSCNDHRGIVSRIANGSGIRVLLFEHRLAPEHPFPAALEDTLSVYQELLSQGFSPNKIMIAGESAGGGLCLATLLALRDQNLPLPACAVALSPWTDLKLTGDSIQRNANSCLAPPGMNLVCSKYYAGDHDPALPWISPLYGELHGLPQILIHVGGDETLLDDSTRFAQKAKAAGVDVTLKIGDGMMHCYPLLPSFIPEARQAMQEICAFIQSHLNK